MSPKTPLLEHYKIKFLRLVETHNITTRSGRCHLLGYHAGQCNENCSFSQKVRASIFRAEETSTLQNEALNLILYNSREIFLYTIFFFQPIAGFVLMLFHNTSATNCGHLQGATTAEELYSLQRTFRNKNCKIFIYVSGIPNDRILLKS
jgi:hypothetical protein